MIQTILADSAVEVGKHKTAIWPVLGSVNVDTILSASIAAGVVILLAIILRMSITSTGVPKGTQLFFEAITKGMRDQIEGAIGMRIAPFVLPLAVTIFTFVLISNWVSVLPTQYEHEGHAEEIIISAAGDVNYVFALALFVFCSYHLAGIWRRGIIGHPARVLKGHVALMAPFNIVEEIAKPVSLALRLFGNMFAGGIMLSLIALMPMFVMWAPNAVWKIFDLFVGLIQAFIFSLLTILYFAQAMEMDEHH